MLPGLSRSYCSSLALLVVLMSASACFTPRAMGDKMAADIKNLQQTVDSLEQEIDMLQATVTEWRQLAEERLIQLGQGLTEIGRSSQLNSSDLTVQLERMVRDVESLRGAVEITDHRLQETETRLQQQLSERMTAISAENQANNNAGAAGPQVNFPSDKKAAWAMLQKLRKEESGNNLRPIYRTWLQKWPKEAGMSDEIMFALAELSFQEKNFATARREFVRVLEQFPQSNWNDDVYYHLGLCSIELQQWQDGETFLTEVLTNHKKSPFFKLAKAKLDSIRANSKKSSTASKK